MSVVVFVERIPPTGTGARATTALVWPRVFLLVVVVVVVVVHWALLLLLLLLVMRHPPSTSLEDVVAAVVAVQPIVVGQRHLQPIHFFRHRRRGNQRGGRR